MINVNSKFNEIIRTITELRLYKNDVIIAIDGMCASGKTTLAEELKTIFEGRVIHMDDFFLPLNLRTGERLGEPGGNIDYDRFILSVISHLDNEIKYQPFICSKSDFGDEINLPKTSVTIIEGAYAMHPKFGEYYDYAIFLKINSMSQLERIERRNGKDKVDVFKNKWIKLENTYFSTFNIQKRANIIIDTTEDI